MEQSDIGVYGLGVMGRNLALNLEEKGYTVSIYNRMAPREEGTVRSFLENEGSNKNFVGSYSTRYFIQSVEKPRKILIMVKAGTDVDYAVRKLRRYLSRGDILIDGSDSHYADTNRRTDKMKSRGYRFVGMGISGGEEALRHGPSLMPGGDKRAWKTLKPILKSIAAKTPSGESCCAWLGGEGAGHFVKMAHNGIEYALMQLLAEAYHFMKAGLAMDAGAISRTFRSWNEGLLSSYLLDITCDILNKRDDDGNRILDYILDTAGQNHTSRWAALTALKLETPLPLITEAVHAGYLSRSKDLREEAAAELPAVSPRLNGDRQPMLESLRQALLASSLVAWAEGLSLLKAANMEWGWEIPLSTVARLWQGGSTIRSALLEPVAGTLREVPNLPSLMLAPSFRQQFSDSQQEWRRIVARAAEQGIPVPAMSAALAHYDMFRSRQLPANLIQAQRDYFGAHTYERTDQHRGTYFHTDWKEPASST